MAFAFLKVTKTHQVLSLSRKLWLQTLCYYNTYSPLFYWNDWLIRSGYSDFFFFNMGEFIMCTLKNFTWSGFVYLCACVVHYVCSLINTFPSIQQVSSDLWSFLVGRYQVIWSRAVNVSFLFIFYSIFKYILHKKEFLFPGIFNYWLF